jgi:hypothetical protein
LLRLAMLVAAVLLLAERGVGAFGVALETDVVFVRNDGQWRAPSRFVAHAASYSVRLEGDGLALFLPTDSGASGRASVVRLVLEGAGSELDWAGEAPVQCRYNYFLGADPRYWRSGVPGFSRVVLRHAWDGLDLVLHGDGQRFEYDLEVDAGADLSAAVVRCEGIEGLSIDENGALVLATALGSLRQPAPIAWEVAPDGTRHPIACRYRLLDRCRYGFELPDHRSDAVIDPGLEWSTLVGGSIDEQITALAVTPSGEIIACGNSNSADFPTTPGVYGPVSAGPIGGFAGDVVVFRLAADGDGLVYSTFLGGAFGDQALAMAVDAAGAVTLAGTTGFQDFPVTPGALNVGGGVGDMFVTRLDPTGSRLIFSALLGGAVNETPEALAWLPDGSTVVVGTTVSSDFPVTAGALQPTKALNGDGFVTRLSADASSLVFSTFLGGDGADTITALAVDPLGGLVLAGAVSGSPPITPGAFDPHYGPGKLYVARLADDGSAILAGTWLGGNKSDGPTAIECTPDGDVIVSGYTASEDFPTTPGAFQPVSIGSLGHDGFVTRFDPALTSLRYSTFLTGGMDIIPLAMHLDPSGVVTLAGVTAAPALPVTEGCLDDTLDGFNDAFVARFSPDGSSLYYGTFLGGSSDDPVLSLGGPMGLDIDAAGSAVVGADTYSPDFPVTPGAFQTERKGPNDGYLSKLDMLPTGVSHFGASTPGCDGPLAAGVTAMPKSGSKRFKLTCTRAPPLQSGFMIVGSAALTIPVGAAGADLWLDLSHPAAIWLVTSDELGFALQGLPVPSSPQAIGLSGYVQFYWKDRCGPSGWSASNALSIMVQP